MKKTKRIFLAAILLFPSMLFGQSKPKIATAYKNHVDFLNDSPLVSASFIFIPDEGRNFYCVIDDKSDTLRIKNKEIKYSIWIIKDGEDLYVNSSRLGLADGYIRLESGHKYYYIMSEPKMTIAQQEKLRSTNQFNNFPTSSVPIDLLGITVETANHIKVKKELKRQRHRVLVIEEGFTRQLTKEFIEDHLLAYPILLEEFEKEPDQNDIEILKTYLEIIDNIETDKW